jgi:hypothetical protein
MRIWCSSVETVQVEQKAGPDAGHAAIQTARAKAYSNTPLIGRGPAGAFNRLVTFRQPAEPTKYYKNNSYSRPPLLRYVLI